MLSFCINLAQYYFTTKIHKHPLTKVAGFGRPFSKKVTLLTGGLEFWKSHVNVTLVPSVAMVFPEIRIFVGTKNQ